MTTLSLLRDFNSTALTRMWTIGHMVLKSIALTKLYSFNLKKKAAIT